MTTFKNLKLNASLLSALSELGYETPSPIQAQGIPILLQGRDLIAQAQTGSGKTASFALPILQTLDLQTVEPQALIIAPTRELAIQVAEAFKSYAKQMKGFHVLPIYGGQDYKTQLKALKRGAHVVVGTPGRVMDHLRRKTLKLHQLKTIILDEADEMLKMGFIDDVEWILEQLPKEHQTALFSATMPASIQKVAKKYIHDAAKISIKPDIKTVESIDQYYTVVSNQHKLEALTRFLEVDSFDGVIIFSRTKTGTSELAEKLQARGYAAAALNGDMNQALREKVINSLKRKKLDIIVATEVAARGLDVERIGFVINYDIPYDPESYVHRIGRTGRAGRKGKALLFVTPREQRMLKVIERSIKRKIQSIEQPSAKQISQKRAADFNDRILKVLANQDLDYYRELIEKLVHDSEHSELDIAAAIAYLIQKKKPLSIKQEAPQEKARPKKSFRQYQKSQRPKKRQRKKA